MNIKHIFFDLDHTLWDTDYNSQLAFEKCFSELEIRMELPVFLEKYVPLNEHYWDLYTQDKMTKEELKYKRFRDTFDHFGYVISDEKILELSEIYLHYLPQNNYLFDGAMSVLQHFHSQYKLHIITNGFLEVSHQKLKLSGIYDFFDQIITSDCAGGKKPDPKVFQYALEKAQASAIESIMVGDNFEVDIKGALSVGMKAIYYNHRNLENQNDVPTIKHLSELKSLIS